MLSNVPHVACNVWLIALWLLDLYLAFPLSHTLRATCGTLLSIENKLLTLN